MNPSDTLARIIALVLDDRDSDELLKLARRLNRLDARREDIYRAFCKSFDMGEWFYESLALNDVDLVTLIYQISQERAQEEKEWDTEQDLIELDRRMA